MAKLDKASNKEKPTNFIRRKEAAAMSTGELMKRTDLSRNTVKAFLKGATVRESTVQKLNEALRDYIAEQKKVNDPNELDPSKNVTSLHPEQTQTLEQCRELAVRLSLSLREAVALADNMAIQDGVDFGDIPRRKILSNLKQVNALLIAA